MNKSLLLLATAAVIGTGTAAAQLRARSMASEAQAPALKIRSAKLTSASDALVTSPTGTMKDYAMSLYLYVNALQPDYDEYDLKNYLVYDVDGKTVWFRDLFMGKMGGYAKGEISGKTLTIASGQYVGNSSNGEKLYLLAFTPESDGSATLADGITFSVADGVLKGVNDNVYAGLWTYDEKAKTFALTNTYAHKYVFNEVKNPHSAIVPDGAKKEQYIMTFFDGWRNGNYTRIVDVARQGDDIYMNGLSFLSRDDYFKGTVSGNEAVFESNQTVSGDYTYWTKLVGAQSNGSVAPTFSFAIADDGSMTMTNAGLYEKMMFDGMNYDLYQNVALKKYAGDHAATPASPKYLKCVDTKDFNNQVTFVMTSTDVDGNQLNPDLLYYRMYVDGEPYTFTPARYQGVTEAMTLVPYSYYNSYTFNDNYQNKYKLIYLDDIKWNRLEVESVYIAGGEERVSPERSVYNNPAGVVQVDSSATVVSEKYTDLLGREIAAPVAGSVYIKTTVYDNGTVSNEKVTLNNDIH